MNQGTEYTSASSYYYKPPYSIPTSPNPNPNPYYTSNSAPSAPASSSASAPPYSPPYSSPEYPAYTQYPPTQDLTPPYSHLPSQPQPQPQPQPQSQSQYNYPSYSSPPYYTNLNENPSPYPSYDNSYTPDSYGQGGGAYYAENSYQDFYGKKSEPVHVVEGLSEGVYAYDGGRSEPYGARGTVPTSSPMLFDDYGRSISVPGGTGASSGTATGTGTKIVKAVPKMDTKDDVKNGVQKFRVKLLAEGAGSATDVLCQIGLDGIRMLDPSTGRMLKVYPLETVTRWEVLDSSIFAFWSKSTVDFEPKRIRLKSNSYTTGTLLDIITAATVQFKEIGGSSFTKAKVDAGSDQQQGKKGFDWMNLIKIPNEEKDHWVPDEAVKKCTSCGGDFNAFNRRHHCRNCGEIFCDKCSQGRIALTAEENAQPVRVCDQCMAEVSHRLSIAKEAGSKPTLQSHEDLARKLQEALEINRKSSSSSKSSGSGGLMREVACPVCTVHLEVQVPKSGSETIECGVCQHPFLVSAD